MKNRRSGQLIRFLNIGFLIINISAFITILLMGQKPLPSLENRDIRSVSFLQEKLLLTREQNQEVLKMSESIFRRYNRTLDLICQNNVSLLEEMAKQEPDQEQLRRLTARIGRMHMNLKNLTVEYFDNVRSICTQEQNARLASLFAQMMQLDLQCQSCSHTECPQKQRLSHIASGGQN